jgi:hypothetical protein
MFEWYRLSDVCYAYLSDVGKPGGHDEGQKLVSVGELMKSQWFTRGWTLQPLIAPKVVRFFSSDWAECGNRNNLALYLYEITNIDPEVLNQAPGIDIRPLIYSMSISKRMSWAAMRETKRPEDKAYCLLGLFNVNIPLIYGEGGPRAFHRLQEEIMKYSTDQTILAWSPTNHALTKTMNVLADSPFAFRDGAKLVPIVENIDNRIEMTSKGVRIANRLYDFNRVLPYSGGFNSDMKVTLLSCVCADQDERGQLGIAITQQFSVDGQADGASFVRVMYAPVVVPVKQIMGKIDIATTLLSEVGKSMSFSSWEYGGGEIINQKMLNERFETIEKYLTQKVHIPAGIYIAQNIQNTPHRQQQTGAYAYCYFPSLKIDIPQNFLRPQLKHRRFFLACPSLIEYPPIDVCEISTFKLNTQQHQHSSIFLTERLFQQEGPYTAPASLTLSRSNYDPTRLEVQEIQCHCEKDGATTPKCSSAVFEEGMHGTTFVRCHGYGLEMQVRISQSRISRRMFNVITVTVNLLGNPRISFPPAVKFKKASKLRGLLGSG